MNKVTATAVPAILLQSQAEASCNMAIQLIIEEAREIGKHPTNLEAVIAALQEYILRHKQLQIINLFSTIEYEP